MKKIQNKELYSQYFNELRERIYEKNLHLSSTMYGIIRIFITISLYVVWLFFIWDLPIFIIVFYFYILSVELGFISHDLIHNQYFKNRKINLFFSYITANLLIWLSRSWWEKKHNIEHHNYTNSDIHDTDIRDYDEIFTKNKWKSIFFHKYKTILFWFATSLLYFRLIFLSYDYIITSKKYWEFFLNLSNILILPIFLFYNFWLWIALLIIIIIYILVWVHLAFVFMTNHIWMEVIDWDRIREYSWIDLQTITSRNITGWFFVHELFGWLNKQIEHHIFPQIARNKIIAVSDEVKVFCLEKWIQYHDVSFWTAISEIYSTLKTGKTL